MKWLIFTVLAVVVASVVRAQSGTGVVVGAQAPEFMALDSDGRTNKLSDYRGKWVVLYFYPKAFTPGCTTESCSLRDGHASLDELKAVIIGVSLDTVEKQAKFKKEYNLPFILLSDSDKAISRAYDNLALGSLFAKRRTFIISPDGKIAHIIESVKPGSHDKQVADVLKDLQRKI
ncbi:MAG: peroxiredoxin [bacterium]